MPEWETYLKETAKIIIQKQNSAGYILQKYFKILFLRILEVRQRFYEMLCRCIPTSIIFVVGTNFFYKMR